MFKHVKRKLTILYSFSLLFFLILFIVLLYFFISNEIASKDEEELRRFFSNERHEFIEELYEHNEPEPELEFDPQRKIFFYVFSESNKLQFGEETLEGFSSFIKDYYVNKENSDWKTMTDEWNGTHFMLIKEPLPFHNGHYGTVYIGMDITSEKHLIQNLTWILIALTLLFSVLFGLLGYYFAGQAMKPIGKAFDSQRKFVSDASHELRTPLSVFYSSIDLLMREEKQNLSPFGQEVLEDVKSETEIMNRLINDLLLLARSDNQQFTIERKELNLSVLLRSIGEKVTRTVPKDIEFKILIEDEIYLNGDEVRIQQLVYILLENAFRYTSKGFVMLTLKKQGDFIVLTIEDSGAGIKKENLPHIFERFYRGDVSRVRDGSGLGLSIARTIVDAHHGEINVKSEPGEGTQFTIVFMDK